MKNYLFGIFLLVWGHGICQLPTSISGYSYKGLFNGHAYFLSNTTKYPEDANTAAIALGGHLATISDATENNLVASFSTERMWIGFTDRTTEGVFRWYNGETVTYSNWYGGEPDDSGGGDWTVINWSPGTWNDLGYGDLAKYVVEFECGASPTAPPASSIKTTYTKVNVSCFGAANGSITITAIGGTPPYLYKNGANGTFQTSNVFCGLSAATYTIYVKDATGYVTAAGQFSITQPTSTSISVTKQDVACNGTATGRIIVKGAGGTPPYKYRLNTVSTVQTSDTFSGLCAGSYLVYMWDSKGCSAKSSAITVGQPAAMTISYTKIDASCNAANGSITPSVSGGTTPYLYSKTIGGPYQTTNAFPNLPAGNYTIFVRDGKLCTGNTGVISLGAPPEGWNQKVNLPGSQRFAGAGFAIGNIGYVGTGEDGNNVFLKDFWAYNPTTNTWTRKADFGGSARYFAVAFSVGGKGYIGTGHDYTGHLKDFWEYDPTTDIWTPKADFQGPAGFGYFAFSIGNKGYVGSGTTFWEYDPAADKWTRKADPGGGIRGYGATFTIGNKGYVGTGVGEDGKDRKDFWEYDPSTDRWTPKADFSVATQWVVGFSIGNKGYFSSGWGFWQYDPATNSWTEKSYLTAHHNGVGFAIDSKGYVSTGRNSSPALKDLWEYSPDCGNVSSLAANRVSRVDNERTDIVSSFVPQLSPNPSNGGFVLLVKSNKLLPVQVKVIDMNGKAVHFANGIPNQPLAFGEKFTAGTYLVEVRQGSIVKTTKGVKVR